MAYLNGCSHTLELTAPAQGRFNSQHFTRSLCCWSLWHLSAMSLWEPLLRPQTCLLNSCPSLAVPDTPPGIIPSSLGKDSPLPSLSTVFQTFTFLRHHICSFWLFLEARMRSRPRLGHVRCGLGFSDHIALSRDGVKGGWRVM